MAVESLSRAVFYAAGRLVRVKWVPFTAGIAAGAAGILALLPMQLVFAHALALKGGPIMNDAWYDALIYVKNNTPEKSFVQSWWPPGYFITAIAERRVSSDGGTQHLPETYWIARFFTSQDEKEALSILKMLHVSGNDAMEYLISQGLPLEDAIGLMNDIFVLRSEELIRGKLEVRLNTDQIEHFLPLIRFKSEPEPAYIFVYSEMIEKSLAITLHARWNFVKAKEMAKTKAGKRESKDDYIKSMIEISEGILKYLPESKLKKRTDTLLAFENGLVVDLSGHQSAILGPDQKVQGQPMSLLYLEQGEIKEVYNSAMLVDVSALVFEREGQYFSVLADRRLLRSILFRLFYLEGASLQYFQPFYETINTEADTEIKIFQVRWDKFMDENKKEKV